MIFGMPPSFVLAILCLLLAGLTFLVYRSLRSKLRADEARFAKQQADTSRYGSARAVDSELRSATTSAKVVAWIFLVAIPLLVFNASANLVPSQHTGIVVEYKAATGGETGKGLVFVKPWQTVSSWDNSRQSWDFLTTEPNCVLGDKTVTGVLVRIAGSQTACVETKIEWRSIADQSAEQWAAYREHDFDKFKERRIEPALTNAVNQAFETHDPLSNVDKATGAINPPPKAPFVQRIKDAVGSTIGEDIDLPDLRVTIGFIHYNSEVQKQIEEYSKKVLENRVLKQEEQNAEVRKRITETNAQRDLRAWCLEIAEKNNGSQPGWCLANGATPVLPITPSK